MSKTNNQQRFGEVFPQILNFIIIISTFIIELTMILDVFFTHELSFSSSSYILYIGTLISLFMNEFVYDSIETRHRIIHKLILLSSGIASVISFAASILYNGNWWTENIKFWVFHIVRCIIVLAYAILAVLWLIKIMHLWAEFNDDKDDDIGVPIKNPNNLDVKKL